MEFVDHLVSDIVAGSLMRHHLAETRFQLRSALIAPEVYLEHRFNKLMHPLALTAEPAAIELAYLHQMRMMALDLLDHFVEAVSFAGDGLDHIRNPFILGVGHAEGEYGLERRDSLVRALTIGLVH